VTDQTGVNSSKTARQMLGDDARAKLMLHWNTSINGLQLLWSSVL